MAWEDLYQPDVGGTANVSKLLGAVNRGSPAADIAIGQFGEGLKASFLNPPDVPPMEVYGVRGGQIAQPTVSASIEPSRIDMSKFGDWYKQGVNRFGLHADWTHPDMNVNLPDLFAKGGQFVETAPGQPDVIRTADGKTTPITPNNMPMVKTSEQLDKERQVQAGPPAGPTIVPTPAAPVSSALAQPTPGEVSPVAPAPVAPLKPVQPDDLAGKIATVSGMIASAANPRQFGPAGEMLTKVGIDEVTKARADAAAKTAGYNSAAEMAALEAKAKMNYTKAQTDLINQGQTPLARAHTAATLAGIPKEQAQTQLVQAETEFKKIQTRNAAAMAPLTVNIPNVGNVTIDPAHFLQFKMHNEDLALRYLDLAERSKSNAAASAQHYAQAATLLQRVPYPGVEGGLPTNLWAQMQIANNKDWATGNARWLKMSEDVDRQLKPYQDMAALGRPFKVDQSTADAMEVTAKQFLSNPEWKWKGIAIYAMLQRPLPPGMAPMQPSVSGVMGGSMPSPAQIAAELERRRAAGGR